MRNFFAILILGLAMNVTAGTAQTPTQVKAIFQPGSTVHEITLDQPTKQGEAIIVHAYIGAGYQWQASVLCGLSPTWCSLMLEDSQGNSFVQVNSDYAQLWYIPASKGGTEKITLRFSTPHNLAAVVTVWPVSLILMDYTPPRCNQIAVPGEQQLCDPWNPAWSSLPSDDTATPQSFPLTTSVQNELIIAWGSCTQESLTVPPDWFGPYRGGEVFLAYSTVQTAGSPVTLTMSTSPPLTEGQYMYIGLNGFKVIPLG